MIRIPYGRGELIATGFFVAKGVMATNHHVIAEGITGATATYKIGDAQIKAVVTKVLADDAAHDVALVQVKSPTMFTGLVVSDAPSLPLSNKWSTLRKGDRVFLTGNPQGYDLTASHGQISGFRSWKQLDEFVHRRRSHLDSLSYGDILQYDAPTSPGSSGSAVLNEKGEVIGVHMSGPSGVAPNTKAENLNLATSVEYLRKLMQEQGLYPLGI